MARSPFLARAGSAPGSDDEMSGAVPFARGPELDARVERVLADLTLTEKAGQMTQVELNSITPDEVAETGIGSVLSGGGGNPGDGSASAWRVSVDAYIEASRRSRTGIPILYGTDAVHGHNNVLGATIFPHQIGLGAGGDPDLVRRVARAAALETAATGARWSFAPCLGVAQDIRWGRTYESFSSDTALVTSLGLAAIEGWHGDDPTATGVLACAKHYVGEGAMRWGTAGSHRHPWIDWWDGWGTTWQIDQGDVDLDETELRRTHLPPFVAAVGAGVQTVMAMYGSWRGERLHGHRYLLTEVLKGELGFDGFVVSDWMAVDQLQADRPSAVAEAIGAGVDMVMVPFDHRWFVATVIELVERGRLPIGRIDDAVRRILRVKARLGLLGDGPSTLVDLDLIGCAEHRAIAREAVRASVVPLVERGVLPLPTTTDGPVLVAGEALDDIGIACGGWTISWAGSSGPITDGRTILDGLRRILGEDAVRYAPDGRFDPPAGGRRAPYGLVTVHELPSVEGGGDRADLRLPTEQIDLVRRVRSVVDHLVVLVISGRPLLIEPVVELADAVLACWLPGSEADGIAEVLTGLVAPTGRLPMPWPRHQAQIGPADRPLPVEPADLHPAPWPVGHRVPVGPRPITGPLGEAVSAEAPAAPDHALHRPANDPDIR